MKLLRTLSESAQKIVRSGVPAKAPVPAADPQPQATPEPEPKVAARPATLEAGARDVRQRLLRSGASRELTEGILHRVIASGGRGAYAIDAAARVIGQMFAIKDLPKRAACAGSPHLFAFVGPTGCGKTTTLAKLGRRLAQNGRETVFASLDPVGLGALETVGGVSADTDRVEIPLYAVRNAGDFRRVMRQADQANAILIDTPGLSPRDDKNLDRLASELDRIAGTRPLDVFLVLPATGSRSALELALRAFTRTAPTGVVLTKLDEATEPGTALEEVLRARLPLAFLCDGQDVRGHVMRPTPDHCADLFLRGKLA